MEAFATPSPLTWHRFRSRATHRVATSGPPIHRVIVAKKSRAKNPSPKDPKGADPPGKTSSFSGMAAGPGSSSSAGRKSLSRVKASKPVEEDAPPASTDDNDSDSELRAVRALGQKKKRPPAEIRTKTAADFIAEGVEDDTDDELEAFEQADIRFGIDDVLDPFKEDEVADETKRREEEAETDVARVGKSVDVTGDSGVLKELLTPGSGDIVCKGAQVTVEYTGTLDDGSVFDDSRKRSGGFSFELGAGQVIKGWEAGVATMRKGEVAKFNISPSYAYGRRGMPPVIPGNAALTFEIEVADFKGGEREDVKKVAEFNPQVARTPTEIAREYDARLETQEERRKNMSLLERFYIISPFASQTGERPPWWINPNITFVAIAVFCALGFYLVVVAGGIHVGYVDQPVDVNIFK